jgi:peptidoglycan hydrolase-like protein with peptidoglycan-binding domain
MRVLRTLLVTLLVVGLAGAAAYGTGVLTSSSAWRATEEPDIADARQQGRGPTVADADADRDEPLPERDATPEPRGPVLAPGDRGVRVRELQSRLFQLAWFPELTTAVYGPGTRTAVSGFQDKRGLEVTGVVVLEISWLLPLAIFKEMSVLKKEKKENTRK